MSVKTRLKDIITGVKTYPELYLGLGASGTGLGLMFNSRDEESKELDVSKMGLAGIIGGAGIGATEAGRLNARDDFAEFDKRYAANPDSMHYDFDKNLSQNMNNPSKFSKGSPQLSRLLKLSGKGALEYGGGLAIYAALDNFLTRNKKDGD